MGATGRPCSPQRPIRKEDRGRSWVREGFDGGWMQLMRTGMRGHELSAHGRLQRGRPGKVAFRCRLRRRRRRRHHRGRRPI